MAEERGRFTQMPVQVGAKLLSGEVGRIELPTHWPNGVTPEGSILVQVVPGADVQREQPLELTRGQVATLRKRAPERRPLRPALLPVYPVDARRRLDQVGQRRLVPRCEARDVTGDTYARVAVEQPAYPTRAGAGRFSTEAVRMGRE